MGIIASNTTNKIVRTISFLFRDMDISVYLGYGMVWSSGLQFEFSLFY